MFGLEIVDLNLDGQPDLLMSDNLDDLLVFAPGNGTGGFGSPLTQSAGSGIGDFALADFDLDGFLDAAVSRTTIGLASIMLGTGTGAFSYHQSINPGNVPRSIVAGDFDEDGSVDLAISDYYSEVTVFRGDGLGGFSLFREVTVGIGSFGMVGGDFDADGHLDLVVSRITANPTNGLSYLRGNGQGDFDVTVIDAQTQRPYSLTVADLDDDGWLDVAVTDASVVGPTVLRGSPNGPLESIVYPVTTGFAIHASDVNDDQAVDLLVTHDRNLNLLLGNGSLGFDASLLRDVAGLARDVISADLDDDGVEEIVVADAGGASVSLLRGNPTGARDTPKRFFSILSSVDSATGDFDLDGRQDVATVGLQGDLSLIFGEPGGGFGFPQNILDLGQTLTSVVTADFDEDGNLDLAMTDSGGGTLILALGDGVGGFVPRPPQPVGSGPVDVAVADLDANGDLDLVVANRFGNDVAVLLGNGDGTFATAVNFPVGTNPFSVAVGDIVLDGHLDLAVAGNYGPTVEIFEGDGNGSFTTVAILTDVMHPTGLAVGDLDEDGALDLAVADGAEVALFFGDAAGAFQIGPRTEVTDVTDSVALADLNLDGHLDIVATIPGLPGGDNPYGEIAVIPGSGTQTPDAPLFFGTGGVPRDLVLSDLDADGRVDVAIADEFGRVVILTNTTLIEADYIRGDSNGDGMIDIADPLSTLGYLFQGHNSFCLDAEDANDDGDIDAADPVYTLAFHFTMNPPPPAPFPDCGSDPTGDDLGCSVSPGCP